MIKFKSNPLEFTDFLFILLLTFLSLFILTLLLINPVAKKAEIVQKAEYLVILEWNKEAGSDIDLWVEAPDGKIVSFRSSQAGTMHLDKDDMGGNTDTYINEDGELTQVKINQEVVTIRGKQQGEYTVNLHLYRLVDEVENLHPIKVQVIRLNPFSIVLGKEVTMDTQGQEITVTRFSIVDSDGGVGLLNELPKKFINNNIYYDSVNPYSNPYSPESR